MHYFNLQVMVSDVLKTSLKNEELCLESVKKLFVEENQQIKELADKKSAIEHALRDVLIKVYISQDMEDVKNLVRLSIGLAKDDLVSAFFPVSLLVDVFDMKTLEYCENLFTFVEENVGVFKSPVFFTACKNSLLRMCNDLSRRLSRSQNTVFCGRILMFLANFFPFSERSGLNVVSEFNVENTTEFGTFEGNGDDPMGETEAATAGEQAIKIELHLYSKFWAVQDYFRCPYKVYDKEHFKKFSSYTKEVLAAFKSFKLEETGRHNILASGESTYFFAKFLTNSKLLHLQLSDSNFRRTILVQYLILFQYLVSVVKFKGENDKLNNTQQEWVHEMENLVYKLLNETPPNGKEFAEAIKHILKREEMWSSWKNDGCKEISRPEGFDKKPPENKKRKLLGDQMAIATKKAKFDLGNAELTHLWNLCPDNLQACKGSDRNFLPPLETYLQQKTKTDPTYEWRALRLVSRQSIHFFTMLTPTDKVDKISDYLQLFNQKIQKDKAEIKVESSNSNNEIAEVLAEEIENAEAMDDQESDEHQHKSTKATSDQIAQISKEVGNDWKKLGIKLGIENEALEDYGSTNAIRPCAIMLANWFEEDVDASLENLAYTLEGLNLLSAANLIKDFIEPEEN